MQDKGERRLFDRCHLAFVAIPIHKLEFPVGGHFNLIANSGSMADSISVQLSRSLPSETIRAFWLFIVHLSSKSLEPSDISS
jgi:hypothetical protein